MDEVVAWLGLGSNEGDREAELRRAVAALAATPGIRVLQVSSFRESAAVGGPPQEPFLNGVCKVATRLPPHALLAVGKALERAAGRALPAPRNHPRPLDVDLLLYGDRRIDTRDLIVPHPALHEREFALAPLRELGVDVAATPRWNRPQVLRSAAAFAALCGDWQRGGCRTGLVPTMGALHAGHASLLRRAAGDCDRVSATIFVNPLQFGPQEDFAAYPRQFEQDLRICAEAGVAAVFAPSVEDMFPTGFCSRVAVGREAEGMEGTVRPGHFAGVATVVARLLALSRPDRAYFGQKDAQQCAVIRRLVADLGFPVDVVECPIVRERDGLAMSSRNVYLGDADRRASTVLFAALGAAVAGFGSGDRDRDRLLAMTRARLAAEPRAHVDYLELRTGRDLAPSPPGPVAHGRMLVAARFLDGVRPVRLIDNVTLGGEGRDVSAP